MILLVMVPPSKSRRLVGFTRLGQAYGLGVFLRAKYVLGLCVPAWFNGLQPRRRAIVRRIADMEDQEQEH